MKLTKKLEAEVLKFYHTYWDSYSNGDVKTFAGTLDKTFELIGTSESEICHTREDGIKFLKAQIKELGGKVEMRNRKISVVPVNELMLVNERCDIYILTGQDWRFYSKIRISTFLRKTTSGWKVFQQHGSFPDIRVQKGETLALNKISKENLQLRDAIKRRTIELEEKNRELEIETALEKVRSIAMSMKERVDMLKICKTISLQLAKLGVRETRNVQTAIFNVPKGTYMNYEYYAKHDKTFITETTYTDHKVARAFAAKMLKGKGEVSITYIKGREKVKEWLNYQKGTNVFIDAYLNTATSLTYYWYSLGPVALGISAYTPLTKDEQGLFSRFLKVFELAYRRYLDIERAEAQAREAQIEASLEKVRAQALGMRKPEELTNICEVLFKELKHLGFTELRNSMINIHDDDKKTFVNYDYSDEIGKSITPLYYDIHPVIKKQIKQIRSADDAFSETVFKGRDLASWKAFRKSRGEKEDKRIKNSTALYYYFYSIGTGSIGISTFTAINEEKRELLKRFRNVFAFAYRRYMDVAQAEAQAREAQIEAALERVRAASMAMRDSSALSVIIYKVYVELTKLDTKLDRCFIMMVNPENKGITWWMAGHEGLLAENGFFVQMNQHPSHLMYLDNCKKRKKKWTYLFEGKEKRDWDRFGFSKTELAMLPEPVKAFMAAAKKVYLSGSSDQFGSLVTGSFEPLPEEQQEIISRFTIVFNQAYTRFLDLQKAEAQAREAQIETSLERVRAQAMAMHKPDDLLNVSEVMFKELTALGFSKLRNTMIHTFNDKNDFFMDYDYSGTVGAQISKIPAKGIKIIDRYWTEIKKGTDTFLEFKISGKELQRWKNFRKTTNQLDDPRIASAGSLYYYYYSIGMGDIGVSTFSPLPYDKIEILERFKNVFQLSYQRYADLQKAEAQAREAQIELALERVRARTMAMQHSEELSETVTVMFEQFKALGEEPERMAIEIVNEKEHVFEIWATQHGGSQLNLLVRLSLDEPHVMQKMYKAWKAKTRSITIDLQGNELEEYFNYLKKAGLPVQRKIFGKRRVQNVATFSKGILTIITPEPKPHETIQLLERFASVFDGTYTRFLDLQKAEAQAKEAQAKEAQIEAALERVRSRSMAMHKSDEMLEAGEILFLEMQKLGIESLTAGYVLMDKEEKNGLNYTPDPSTKKIMPEPVIIPHNETIHMQQVVENWKKGSPFFIVEMDEEETIKHQTFIAERSINFPLNAAQLIAISPARLFLHNFYFKEGYVLIVGGIKLSAEQTDIMLRFAKVFQQTYTRFLDLQKAEAQAREAKIEAALERTRTQSMIMQHSKELDDTLRVFHEQVLLLGIRSAFSFLWLPDEKSDRHIFWAAWAENNSTLFKSKAINYPLDRKEPATVQCLMDWKSDEPVHSYNIPAAGVENYFAVWSELFAGAEQLQPKYFNQGLHYVEAFMKYGCFGVMVENALTEDEKKTLLRFAIEFERTYTRFLDLQKAEAQTREAEIQLALERVRAKSLAMHHTSELQDVVDILARQLKSMGMDINGGVLIAINDEVEHEENFPFWAASGAADYVQKVVAPFLDRPILTHLRDAIVKRNNFFTETYSKEEKDEMFHHLFRFAPWNAEPEERKNELLSREGGLTRSAVISQHTTIAITNHNGKIFTYDEHEILKRFGNVFEQSYIRFLDLQKAETQAREAQIEASLERVRSRTMAMQKSEELTDVAGLLFSQMTDLGIKTWTTGFNVWSEDNTTYVDYITSPKGGFIPPYTVDLSKTSVLREIRDARKNGETFYVQYAEGEKLRETYIELAAFGDEKQYEKMLEDGVRFPSHQYDHFVFGSKVSLMFITYEPVPEAHEIFKRFGQVFEQTYTRFLDLQKAEAQAREAQIEAALERVRAKAMAMHNSEDIAATVDVFFKELKKLGITPIRCGVGQIDEETKTSNVSATTSSKQGDSYEVIGKLKLEGHPVLEKIFTHWKKQEEYYPVLKGEELTHYYKTMNPQVGFPDYPDDAVQYGSYFYFKEGLVFAWTEDQLSEEAIRIFHRFTSVIALTYRRYMDLKEAEAQAREAQIEAALERVRSRSMAMHKSEELSDLSLELVKQVQALGVATWFCAFNIYDDDPQGSLEWGSNGQGVFPRYRTPREGVFLRYYEAGQRGEKLLVNEIGKDECTAHYEYLCSLPGVGDQLLSMKKAGIPFPSYQIDHVAFFRYGYILFITYEPVPETHDIFKRFARVFEQTYTRFLDLQKAEAQAREAQIEAALEKVRSSSLAMHKSDEIEEVLHTVFEKLKELGIDFYTAIIILFTKDSKDIVWWLESKAKRLYSKMLVPYADIEYMRNLFEVREKGIEFFSKCYLNEEKMELFRHLFEHTGFANVPEEQKKFLWESEFATISVALANNTAIHITSYSRKSFSDQDNDVLKRFAKVFEQAYTRFLDLQKAEEQAREAKIEAALERVRSRSMAMHKSDELKEVIKVVLEQFTHLNINVGHAGFYIDYRANDDMHIWLADPNIEPFYAIIPYFDTPTWNSFLEAKRNGTALHTDLLNFEEKNNFYNSLFKLFTVPDEAKKFYLECKGLAVSTVLLDNVGLYIENFDAVPYSDEENNILMRFGKVFQQTYTRFLDLQRAEAQAKEAQIETALERVRSRSLAMHHSSELSAVVDTLLREFTNLEFTLTFCIINLIDEQDRSNTVWAANPETGKDPESYYMKFEDYPFHHAMWDAWKAQKKNFIYTIEGGEKRIYDEYLYTRTEFRRFPKHVQEANKALKRYVAGFTFFKYSGLQTVSENHISDEELDILERFGRVFEQSYTRFLDLQKAEAQAREAQIEAALEKVRSRSLAMQQPKELTEVAELLRKEMGQLGVEELETSSIYIVGKENLQAECWYAIKDIRQESRNLVSDEMTIIFADTWVGNEMGRFYRGKKEHISIVMRGDNRKEWINYCAGKSKVLQGYYGDEIPERTYHLVKFNGGYMGAASPGDISAESWDLLRRAASVFSLAYTRFNDLKIAEAHALQAEQDLIAIKEAKQKAEEALTELQATQKQLIQSEKMASLGELTAGIAHEIQNPLNFVNNFSEVSKELLDEMKEVIEKGDAEEAKEIMNDVIQNLEKINHHGKRADGIVKGMLQHSRSSSNQKEATDINALADEYLRLAYHGLRAKDKTFNATMKTEFDESIGNINIIPQDIGRVILNLITNAFYVVNEKKTLRQAQGDNYEPTVSVSTKKVGDKVEIKVTDNGNGIPQKILDKIFQPFFTTKPTGQGTGLGLSLSYDIVKAHSGEIKVNTKENVGTEFTIVLPKLA